MAGIFGGCALDLFVGWFWLVVVVVFVVDVDEFSGLIWLVVLYGFVCLLRLFIWFGFVFVIFSLVLSVLLVRFVV